MSKEMSMDRWAAEVRERYPFPGDDPVERLRHTVAMFADQPKDAVAILATSGIYGYGVQTGVTWGDLRAIVERL